MTIRRLAVVLSCLGLAAVVHELHAQAKPEAMATTPSEMKWEAQGGLAMAGMEQVNLVGNPSKPPQRCGSYLVRNVRPVPGLARVGSDLCVREQRGLNDGVGISKQRHWLRRDPPDCGQQALRTPPSADQADNVGRTNEEVS